MPKVAMDYSKTHFYKIVSKDLNIQDCYVGHTTSFNKRKGHHKHICYNSSNRCHNIYLYQFIRENGGWDNFQMILIKTENCLNKLEAENRERYYIETLKATLNKSRPTITNEEKKHMIKYTTYKTRINTTNNQE